MKAKTLLLIGCWFTFALTARANSIVSDTFGPGNTYQQNSAYNVGYGFQGPAIEVAALFQAEATGTLSTVDLGLTFDAFCGPVNVFLYGDSSLSPNNGNQTLLGSVAPTTQFGTTNNSVVSFNVLGNVNVTMGTKYWLVLKAVNPNDQDKWNYSLSADGGVATSTNDSTWAVAFESQLPAFRLTTQMNGVPDTGNSMLLMLGAVAVLGTLRSKFGAS
jgi:hypothetical protein